ncbi:glycosyltransferase family 2 protein [Sphingomonas sp. CL5.1]|uniref:glycosyltransferase family 2 protein n=1 Tax=Sphingomonas sp. CL5.1 TaxID=2653203 RepID=UPI001584046C|nr:glycosyltransferase family 2 protein [Sphingomonas sp. CL5.1]QKR99437.1 glycosyltransferase family 2 protein [Sphingomonas sp. CL5.1]
MNGLAVIIVNYRTPDLSIACIAALEEARRAFPGLRVVAVDGGSGDGSAARIAEAIATNGWSEWVTPLPLEVNGGFAFANNQAIALLAEGGEMPEAIALINPDARVRPGALEAMADLLDREPRAGAVGALLTHEDGRPQSSAFRFPSIRGEFCRGARTRAIERLLRVPPTSIQAAQAVEVPWVTGAAVMLRTAALRQTGLFDDGFFLYFEETDLMRRLRRAGWAVWHEPAARVVHAGGAATQIRDPGTGLPHAKRMPRYWYESHRRYFALAGGSGAAIAAGLAFFAGHAIWRARRLVSPRLNGGAHRSARDLLAYGWWPSRRDVTPSAPPLGPARHVAPSWMDAP